MIINGIKYNSWRDFYFKNRKEHSLKYSSFMRLIRETERCPHDIINGNYCRKVKYKGKTYKDRMTFFFALQSETKKTLSYPMLTYYLRTGKTPEETANLLLKFKVSKVNESECDICHKKEVSWTGMDEDQKKFKLCQNCEDNYAKQYKNSTAQDYGVPVENYFINCIEDFRYLSK